MTMAPKDVEKIGKQLTEGALSAIGKWAIIAALGIAAWHWAWPPARDATDPPTAARSDRWRAHRKRPRPYREIS